MRKFHERINSWRKYIDPKLYHFVSASWPKFSVLATNSVLLKMLVSPVVQSTWLSVFVDKVIQYLYFELRAQSHYSIPLPAHMWILANIMVQSTWPSVFVDNMIQYLYFECRVQLQLAVLNLHICESFLCFDIKI